MVRTRFAPSPTGYMHIGNLRTALYAFLYARRHDGQFILRIEDTDRKRNVPAAIRVIYNSLKLAGIDYDEGPDKGGEFGPYVQSQRKEMGIYSKYAAELMERGQAYPCFCSNDSAKGIQSDGPERRDPCRYLSPEAVQQKLAAGEPYVIRQRIPDEGSTTFVDHVYGEITIDNADLDDQILLKSDGYPTYNFANVVDDHLMQISHVIRGLEYLSSTPKYNLLYQSFGWDIPEYIHLPHIVKDNGRKLSKREGDASFEDLLAKGYLPEAIVNYIALLGWSPGNDQEFFTLADLIREFDIDRINKSKAAFSTEKLDWLNGQHIRALSLDDFHARAAQYYPAEIADRFDTRKISQLIQARVVRLADIPEMVGFLAQRPDFDLSLFVHEKSKSTLVSSLQVLNEVYPVLEGVSDWSNQVLVDTLKAFAGSHGFKTGTVMWPVRVAITGLQMTPGGATEIAEILGKDETLRRLAQSREQLAERTPEA